MLIIGAKGFAKEVLEVAYQCKMLENLSFFDDINESVNGYLYDSFPILKSITDAQEYFKTIDSKFTIGIGNPTLRLKLYHTFSKLGGVFTTLISSTSVIGHYNVEIGNGCNIMQRVILTNDIKIGDGVLINQQSSIGHDVVIGDFVEICPSVSVSGNCSIGENSFIGTGAIILPNINIGANAIVGAGSVVTQHVPDNCTIVGVPGKIIKQNPII